MLTKNEPVRFEELDTLMKTEQDLLKSIVENSKKKFSHGYGSKQGFFE